MKLMLFIFCCIIAGHTTVHAQSNDWFRGTWYGERTFPQSRIANKALLRMEIDQIRGDLFSGKLVYMYPSDTSERLVRQVGGQLYGKYVIINKGQEIYRSDDRSRSFWSDCSHCPGTTSFYIENGNLVLKITAYNCGDSCNGTTTFTRKMEDYNAALKAVVIKKFGAGNLPVTKTAAAASSPQQKDSFKYFPVLLTAGMGINFDSTKYRPLRAITTDTGFSLNRVAAASKTKAPAVTLPKPTAKKDSINFKRNSTTATFTAAGKHTADVTANRSDAPLNDTVKLGEAAPVAVQSSKSAATSKKINVTTVAPTRDTIAALPAPVKKDTVPAAIIQRTTSLVNAYQVNSPHIAVQLFDDGQIDGDAVSVYYNGKIIISNQTLTHKATTFNIEASAANRHHEFILISESEGFLAPNTALMRIKAGSQQFELTVSSSSARNAKIAIDYLGD